MNTRSDEIVLNRELLRDYSHRIEDALLMGFDLSLSFPAEPLIEFMIDASLRLRKLLQEGGAWAEVNNPELEFFDKPAKFRTSGLHSGCRVTKVDDLANVQNKQTGDGPPPMYDPILEVFFQNLANTLVQIKRTHNLPRHLYCQEGEQRRYDPATKITPETYRYLKRRKDRLKKHNTHQNRKG